MLKSMLPDKVYCVLLSILSLLVVIVTGGVLVADGLQVLTFRSYLLFAVVTILVVMVNRVFYRLLNERYCQRQDSELDLW